MALDTGRKITRRSWDVIPTPDNEIARVNTLGGDQPDLPIFTDRHGRPIGYVKIPGVNFQPEPADDTIDILDPALFPDADNAEIPGVDVEQDTPQIVETNYLKTIAPEPPLIENNNKSQANHFLPDGGGAQTSK